VGKDWLPNGISFSKKKIRFFFREPFPEIVIKDLIERMAFFF